MFVNKRDNRLSDTGLIMIVDDMPDNLRVLMAMLSEYGYEVQPALNGELALKAAVKRKPDLILLDIRMPGIDGFEVCRRLKENETTREIPVIFISALEEPLDKLKAFEVGGLDYITKPFNAAEVLARIRTQMELYRMRLDLEELVAARTMELGLDEKRFEALFALSQMLDDEEERLIRYALAKAVELTRSEAGCLYFLSAAERPVKVFVFPIQNDEGCFSETSAGNAQQPSIAWEECIQVRKPVICNDAVKADGSNCGFASCRHLAVPIFDGGKMVAVIGVAKQQNRYGESDARQLTLFGASLWGVLQRKKAGESLARSENLLREAQHIAHLGNWEWDVAKNELVCSSEIYRIYGLEPEGPLLTYETLQEAIPAEDRPPIERAWADAISRQRPFEAIHRIVRRSDGAIRHVHERFCDIKDQNGRMLRRIGTVQDITEQQLAEIAQHRSEAQLHDTLLQTIRAVAVTLEKRDPYTAGHQQRVAELAAAIAQAMGLPDAQVEGIRLGGMIHDIGKIYVPAEVLARPGKLSELEFKLIKTHPQVGYEIVKDIAFPWPVAEMILQHHERLDGSGYPQGLRGNAILPEARILAVADVVEAMISYRPYRPGLGKDAALNELRNNSGRLYDAVAAEHCIKLFNEQNYTF
ncbi:MAG: HD domain-containing phosphohydrolase [Gammaproteobacteria bacterium]